MFATLRQRSWQVFLGFLALALASGTCVILAATSVQSAIIPRYVEVAETTGAVTFQGRPVAVGDRLSPTASNGLQTGNNGRARLVLDDGIGSVEVGPDSELNISSLETLDNGGKTSEFLLAKGRARVNVRRFNNPNSRFDVRTPAGNAGVRGTEFTLYVRPDGETHMSILDGFVTFARRNLEEVLECGPDSAWIIPANAEPVAGGQIFSDLNLRFELLGGAQRGQVRVMAQTNGTNRAELNGRAVAVNRQGQLNEVVAIPGDRRLRLVIRDLFEREQVYELVVPE